MLLQKLFKFDCLVLCNGWKKNIHVILLKAWISSIIPWTVCYIFILVTYLLYPATQSLLLYAMCTPFHYECTEHATRLCCVEFSTSRLGGSTLKKRTPDTLKRRMGWLQSWRGRYWVTIDILVMNEINTQFSGSFCPYPTEPFRLLSVLYVSELIKNLEPNRPTEGQPPGTSLSKQVLKSP